MGCKVLVGGLVLSVFLVQQAAAQGGVTTPNPVLFVTQVPVGGFASLTSTFGNHTGALQPAPRGGDLVIRYGDGALRFLTQEAGFGSDGRQGANAIAVREPCVHWSGTKALFSMVVGAPTQQYQIKQYRWQIYEVTGLGRNDTASIRHVAGQPTGYNNVSPIYASDDRILFTSDRPATGAAHHYPQRDEYESTATVVGIYALDETSGEVTLLEHSPSGAFSPSVDSFGRVIFTKWDHLQRDQQGDSPGTAATFGAFTWASEAADAPTTTSLAGAEVFPEPRTANDPDFSPALSPHRFNHFFPWEMNQDGSAEETLNHVGRHEFGGSYTDGSFIADSNLTYYVPDELHANRLYLRGDGGLFHLREDPTRPGDFLGTFAPEFGTGSGGILLRLTGAPSVNADDMVLTAVTPTRDDADVPEDTGYFRNPLPLSDGTLLAVHSAATGELRNTGTTQAQSWNYEYRLKKLTQQGAFFAPAANVTSGISKSVTWWTPDVLAGWSGVLWELDPVEVVARPAPAARVTPLPAIEAQVFAQESVDVEAFRAYLRANQLALIVSRNVTQRDRADRHQPFNLRVPGGVSSIGRSGTIYDVSYLQIFQADAVRGYGGAQQPSPGRRLLARTMHGPGLSQANDGPDGAVEIGLDGSMAALVPARRALTWQLTDDDGTGIVRERNWLSFQSGEIRVCTSCHGVNKVSQTGVGEPTNTPEALRTLLREWRDGTPQPTPAPTATPAPTPIAGDACTGPAADKPRMRIKPQRETIVITGKTVIPKPWSTIAPDRNGVRIVIDGVLDLFVPGGTGWTKNAAGTRWLYRDGRGERGSVRRIDVADRSVAESGRVLFTVRIEDPPAMPQLGAHQVTIGFGSATECTAAQFAAPPASSPSCAAVGQNVICR